MKSYARLTIERPGIVAAVVYAIDAVGRDHGASVVVLGIALIPKSGEVRDLSCLRLPM